MFLHNKNFFYVYLLLNFVAISFTQIFPQNSVVVEASWKVLRGSTSKSQKIRDQVTALDGKKIRIPGFIVPLDDLGYATAGRFLLVPDPQSCIHAPAPPPNQMIYVVMENKKQVPVRYGVPIALVGVLKIKKIRSQFGTVSFQVSGESAEQFRGK